MELDSEGGAAPFASKEQRGYACFDPRSPLPLVVQTGGLPHRADPGAPAPAPSQEITFPRRGSPGL
jgi:hypothetical protein